MGITYGRRPRLQDLRAGTADSQDILISYGIAESGQDGYAGKVEIDSVYEPINRELDKAGKALGRLDA